MLATTINKTMTTRAVIEHRFAFKSDVWKNVGLAPLPVISGEIYPPPELVLRQFEEGPWLNDLNGISCVILGQDPYPDYGVAIGRSFAINTGSPIRASLANVISELFRQYSITKKDCPNFDVTLNHWVEQGVFLLNTALTVSPGLPNSHTVQWKNFTSSVIKKLGEPSKTPRVFMLWGREAQKHAVHIDKSHKILMCPHPVAGFSNNGHFLAANEFLVSVDRSPIMWLSIESEKLKQVVIDKMPLEIRKILDEKMAMMRKLESDISMLKIQKTDLENINVVMSEFIGESDNFRDKLAALDSSFENISDILCNIDNLEIQEKLKSMEELIGYLNEDINELSEHVRAHSAKIRQQ